MARELLYFQQHSRLMRLERNGEVVEVLDENVISAFKEAGYIESTPEKAELPEKGAPAKEKKATTTRKTNTK